MQGTAARVDWDGIDTVLVDMDGTLLDLAFDNFFWLELLPEHYAEANGVSVAEARTALARRFDAIAGTLNWYCLDHWTRDLELDIRSLKRRSAHLVRYLPGARELKLHPNLVGHAVRAVTHCGCLRREQRLLRPRRWRNHRGTDPERG